MALVHQTLQVRGYCRKRGYDRLRMTLGLCAELYNAALQERRDAWRHSRTRVGLYDQQRALTAIRAEFPEWSALDVNIGRGVLVRISEAFAGFFRRVRSGSRPGYPRFKPRDRYRTIALAETRPGMVRTKPDGRRAHVRVKGLPTIEIRLKHELPPAEQLRALHLTFAAGKLYVSLTYLVEREPLPPTGREAGVDLGVHQRMALSDGTVTAGRTADRRRERRLRRRLSRASRGSKGRRLCREMLTRETRRNHVRDRNAVHRLTTSLVRDYDRLAVEDLRIGNMTRSAKGTMEQPGTGVAAKRALNRRILDQSWGMVLDQLTYKAVWAGRELVRVDPAYTSRTCSSCGARDAQRSYHEYACPRCGILLDRDVNAARNILVRAFAEAERAVRDGADDSPRSAQSARADALAIVA